MVRTAVTGNDGYRKTNDTGTNKHERDATIRPRPNPVAAYGSSSARGHKWNKEKLSEWSDEKGGYGTCG